MPAGRRAAAGPGLWGAASRSRGHGTISQAGKGGQAGAGGSRSMDQALSGCWKAGRGARHSFKHGRHGRVCWRRAPALSSSSSEGSTGKEKMGEDGAGDRERSELARCGGSSSVPPASLQAAHAGAGRPGRQRTQGTSRIASIQAALTGQAGNDSLQPWGTDTAGTVSPTACASAASSNPSPLSIQVHAVAPAAAAASARLARGRLVARLLGGRQRPAVAMPAQAAEQAGAALAGRACGRAQQAGARLAGWLC